jgi:hypothetical protein
MWQRHCKQFDNMSSKNVSNSDNIVGLIKHGKYFEDDPSQ